MHWSDVEEIVEALEQKYPREDVESLTLTELHEYIIDLPQFEDDTSEQADHVLERIQGKWLELRNEL